MKNQNTQVVVNIWAKEYDCAPGQKYHFFFDIFMKKYDNDWPGYWRSESYSQSMLNDALDYAKDQCQEI